MNRIASTLLAPLLLAGCFHSELDLIGDNAVRMERAESLVTLKGAPYRIDPVPDGYVACELKLKSDGPGNCEDTFLLKFERTGLGNIIVQARGKDDDSEHEYLLVVRQPGTVEACFYILGAPEGDENDPIAQAEKAIATQFPEKLDDHRQLIDVADAYEQTVVPIDPHCAEGPMAILSPTNFVFDGDPKPAADGQ